MEAGARLLAEGGLSRVNSNQLARAAGVGVGTFYSHFEDKHALLRALVLEALDELRTRSSRAAAGAGDDPRAQVAALVEAVVGLAEERPALFVAAFGRDSSAVAGRPAVGLSTRPAARRLRELQQAGRVDASLNPEVAMRAFVCAQNGLVCWWLEDRSRATRGEIVETLVRMHPAVAAAA